MNRSSSQANWDRLSREVTQDRQLKRLREFLREVVVPFSPHYKRILKEHGITADSLRTFADLQQLPLTSKLDLMDPQGVCYVRDFLVTPDQHILSHRIGNMLRASLFGKAAVRSRLENEFRPVFMTTTTGRSMEPIPFLYTNLDLANLGIAGRRIMEVCNASREFRLVNMFPYAPHLAFWLTHYASTEYGVFSVGTGGGKVMGTDGCLRIIEKIKPDVLIGMPTFVYHTLQHAIDQGRQLEGIKRLVVGGEKVVDGMRRKLYNMCGKVGSSNVDVVATYGLT